VAASVRNSIRIVVFVTAVLIALLFADHAAHADDAPAPASTPAPDSGGTPPADTVVTPPPTSADAPAPDATPPSTAPASAPDPAPVTAAEPPPDVTAQPAPDGSTAAPAPAGSPSWSATPGAESAGASSDGATGTGTHSTQTALVGTDGTALADTGSNAAGSSAPPGIGSPSVPGGTSAGVQTGGAQGQGSIDQSGISQTVNAVVTEDGHVVVIQVAVVVNIGIGLAGSGGNIASAESASPPRTVSSVAMIVGSESAGAGTGPTPATISTGSSTATGNTGTTKVTQSIVLTGNDVASQLAAVLNIGVGVSNSGLNFALAAVSGDSSGGPSSLTFVTMGGGSSISAGPSSALGNRSTSAVFQIVTVSASGNGSLLVIQRAIIVNFGLALANSGLNVAGGGALDVAMPDPAAAQELLLMLLDPGTAAPASVGAPDAAGAGQLSIGTGGALAIGNDTTTGIRQQVSGSVSGDETARAIQDAWVGNFGIGVANSGANGAAAGPSGIDAASLDAARGALQAFLAGLTGLGDPLQGLDANFQLGANLLQLHGDVAGTESLLGIAEPGTEIGPDDASVVVRQVTAVLNIGLALGESGHNVAVAGSHATTLAGPGSTAVASTTITTGDALAVGNHFAATVCQAIGDTVTCAAPTPPVDEKPPGPVVKPGGGPQTPPVTPVSTPPAAPPSSTNPFTAPDVPVRAATISTLPFTGSPIGAELAAGSGLLIAGMLLARRRRTRARV
jgi:hypothetical protein